MPLLDDADHIAKTFDTIDRQRAGTLSQVNGEEVGAAFLAGMPIGHGSSSPPYIGVRELTPTYDRDAVRMSSPSHAPLLE